MALTLIPVAELIEDFAIYPRHAVDESHVLDLARAMEAGTFDIEKFPVTADQASKRITNGFHRTRAWRRVYGDAALITAELKAYATEADMVRDAVDLNAEHGRRLDRQDRTRSALLLQKHGIAETEIAVLLHTTEQYVSTILTKVVIVKDGPGNEGLIVPAKPVAYAGVDRTTRQITSEQAAVMRSSSGHRPGQVASQLARELRSGLINIESPGLREKFTDLRDAINEVVGDAINEMVSIS